MKPIAKANPILLAVCFFGLAIGVFPAFGEELKLKSTGWSSAAGAVEMALENPSESATVEFLDVASIPLLEGARWKSAGKFKEGVFRDDFGSLEKASEELGESSRIYHIRRSKGDDPSGMFVSFRLVRLVPGENWIGLCGSGPSLSVDNVFGTTMLPAGSTPGTSGQVTTFKPIGYPFKEHAVWLKASGTPGWFERENDRPAGHLVLPGTRGLIITLPESSSEILLPLVLQVDDAPKEIILEGKGAFNMLANPYPVRVSIEQLGLPATKSAGFNPNESDEIRIMKQGDGGNSSPEARLLLDPDDGKLKYWTGGIKGADAGPYVLDAGRGFVWKSTARSGGSVWVPVSLRERFKTGEDRQ